MAHPEVVIVGSGLAGLAAALELQKRGCKVTIIEQGGDESFGGKLGTHPCDQCGKAHLHTHHIFMNWYRNFWKIVEDLGWDTEREFEPRETVNYLRSTKEMPGASYNARLSSVTNEGSIWHALDNMMEGPESPANMFLYGYSLLDLISTPYRRESILDNTSVNGFMASRWYATPEAATLHQRFLNVAFANASFQTSAETYKNFIRFSTWDPEPQYYVMRQGVRDRLISELKSKLLKGNAKENIPPASILTGTTVVGIVLEDADEAGKDAQRRVRKLNVLQSQPGHAPPISEIAIPEGTSVILAISLDGLARLVDEELYEASVNFQRVHSLRSQTIASLELQYKNKVDGIPRNHTALINSPHHLSLFDGSQVSCSESASPPAGSNLTVAISEFDALDAWDPQHLGPRTSWSKRRGENAGSEGAGTNWDRVKQALFQEVRDFLPDLPAIGAEDRMCLVRNTGARLFINDVHDWNWQPTTGCDGIGNLFLAGEFVQNPIDVVTVESAVVTGLQAAESVRRLAGLGPEVEIIEPDAYAPGLMKNAVAMLTPMALGAATIARAENLAFDPYRLFAEGVDTWLDTADSWLKVFKRFE